MKDQRRTLPRALFITLGLTTVFYALVVLIAVTAIPPADWPHRLLRSRLSSIG